MSDLTPEMREALDRRGDDRMSAYFFGFDSTTSDAVNDVLTAVAFAGKAFHSTEQWGDDDYMPFTMVDLIQATANEAANHIAKVEAERDALRGISNDVLWLTRLAVSSSWPGEMAEQVERAAARVRTLLDPEDGGESPLFTSAQPMSPTMRQAVTEAKQRPPARHFEPSTLRDGERDG